jgi:hypothetical protein
MSIDSFQGRPVYFKLEGKAAVPCSPLEWGRDYDDVNARTVARTFIGTLWVSTVFLGLDHSFGDSDYPALFETMIFDDNDDRYQTRCSTWAEAEAMHAVAVEIAVARVREADAMIRLRERVRAEISEALEAAGYNVQKGAEDGSSE